MVRMSRTDCTMWSVALMARPLAAFMPSHFIAGLRIAAAGADAAVLVGGHLDAADVGGFAHYALGFEQV